ncbi:MAG: carboxymuconolactone decarboxylase family protein [Acidobacteriota bacterium]
MEPRLDYGKAAPGAVNAMLGLEKYLHACSLEEGLIHLVKLRVSQINGCAYCLDMHWKDLRALGESELRLYELAAWEETDFYSERERAALAFAEALTAVAETHVPDAVYAEARRHFSDTELVDLALCVATINAWNRLAITFRAPAGTYQPRSVSTVATAARSGA